MRQIAKELVKFEGIDLNKIGLKKAWDLRDQLDDVAEVLDDFINDEIRRLVKKGWTQTRIAKEVGRSQKTISKRMTRLGIEPTFETGRKRPDNIPRYNSQRQIAHGVKSELSSDSIEPPEPEDDELEIEIERNGSKPTKRSKPKSKPESEPMLIDEEEEEPDILSDDEVEVEEDNSWKYEKTFTHQVLNHISSAGFQLNRAIKNLNSFDSLYKYEASVDHQLEEIEKQIQNIRNQIKPHLKVVE